MHQILRPGQRILNAVEHKENDRVATDMWATVETQEKMFTHFGITTGKANSSPCIGLLGGPLARGVDEILQLWDILGVDGILDVRPPYIGPPIKQSDGLRYNEWGFGYNKTDYGKGIYEEQVIFPLEKVETLEELEAFAWPDPDWYDYRALRDIIAACKGRAVCCGYSAVFTYHNYLRSLETSLMDPFLNPELTAGIIQKISDFFFEYHRRCFEAAGDLIDFTQVTDDWGSQNGLLTSPMVFENFYKDPMQRAIDLAKSYGIYVFHHDDGDMRPLLPTIAAMGISVLNPIQWRCGDWDLAELKASYGDILCFHSAVDNQETLPWGTPEQVKEEVRYLLDILYSDGKGCILGPCHNLQVQTPVENIIALYEAAREFSEKL